MKRILCATLLLILIAGVTAAASCRDSSTTTPSAATTPAGTITTAPAPGADTEVSIENFEYIPETITVAAGTRVVWTNQDSIQHTVTHRNDLFDSGLMGRGESFSYTFNEPGEYEYYCIPHPFMVGRVTVE
jgi:plastocyanin